MRLTGAETVVVIAVTATVVGPSTLVGTAAASPNAPPLPDAGLDQDVPVNSAVYLDANGSRDPDGTLVSVRWSIETPSGTTITPDCRTCRQTQFQPGETGQYNVTLRVTDDDGVTRSDTLFVDTAPDTGPTVSLSGPTTVAANTSVNLTAQIDSDASPLSTVAWVVDGRAIDRESIAGDHTTATFSHVYESTGNRSVRAVVYDLAGYRGEATHSLKVGTLVGGGGGGHDHNCPDGSSYYHAEGFGGCQTGSDLSVRYGNEEAVIVDTNGKDGLQLTLNGIDVTINNEAVDLSEYKLEYGGYDKNGLVSAYKKTPEAQRNGVTDTDRRDIVSENIDSRSSSNHETRNLYGGASSETGTKNMYGGDSATSSSRSGNSPKVTRNPSSTGSTSGMYGSV